ncbi:hypothetical protein QWZ10_21540 [Paracoccus cavernae]|uniref:Uncharacterized protein n=1 Tax=Paracoccus cavernae TaxID=1571207 RepID=A0ABT8DA76_9RHOB|nr:hypothetical protein [Paracoccus cavernae]
MGGTKKTWAAVMVIVADPTEESTPVMLPVLSNVPAISSVVSAAA